MENRLLNLLKQRMEKAKDDLETSNTVFNLGKLLSVIFNLIKVR